ncbi:hypothetical protein [Nocardia sp. NPDC052112]|uniref:hypothetical protein n=1 Tax=Nocardia sp. NPDC052112 TaxID=3155646 RepID=UPI003417E5B3
MSATPIQPRALTELESGVVTKLLSSGAASVGEFLSQIPFVQVVATWGVGSPSVDLAVLPGAVSASGSTDGICASAIGSTSAFTTQSLPPTMGLALPAEAPASRPVSRTRPVRTPVRDMSFTRCHTHPLREGREGEIGDMRHRLSASGISSQVLHGAR